MPALDEAEMPTGRGRINRYLSSSISYRGPRYVSGRRAVRLVFGVPQTTWGAGEHNLKELNPPQSKEPCGFKSRPGHFSGGPWTLRSYRVVDHTVGMPTPELGTIRVFLLDDHEVVRTGVAAMLDREKDIEIVGEAGGAAEALRVVDRVMPDVAVLDVRLADGNGIEVCRTIRSAHDDVHCLILTSFHDDQAILDAAMARAAGYVLKQIRGNELVDAIRRIAGGAVLLDSAAVKMAIQRLRSSEEGRLLDLTPQETKIFDLIGEGRTNRQIAGEMFLAEKTVKNYVSNLLAKLDMSRRTEAAALAARLSERHRRDA